MPEIRELISMMSAIIAEADELIRDGDASRQKLQPLRLRMASTITSFQFAVNARLADMTSRDERLSSLRRAADDWSELGNEFRIFTRLSQTQAAPPWNDYVRQARTFMRRFHDQMHRIDALAAPSK